MKLLLLSLVLMLSGCVSTPSAPVTSNTLIIIAAAAKNAPNGVVGEFALDIKAAGGKQNFVYLNTELDYRDQRNISVAIHPSTATQLEAKYGAPAQDFFINKSITVKGQAKRVKIMLSTQGRMTDKYYYQTHIRVSDADQIEVLSR